MIELPWYSKFWRILIMLYLIIAGIAFPLTCGCTYTRYVHKDKAALYGGIDGYITHRAMVYQDTCKVIGMNGNYFQLKCEVE